MIKSRCPSCGAHAVSKKNMHVAQCKFCDSIFSLEDNESPSDFHGFIHDQKSRNAERETNYQNYLKKVISDFYEPEKRARLRIKILFAGFALLVAIVPVGTLVKNISLHHQQIRKEQLKEQQRREEKRLELNKKSLEKKIIRSYIVDLDKLANQYIDDYRGFHKPSLIPLNLH